MESENIDLKEQGGNLLNKVRPLSKYLALLLLVAMPFIGGWVGYTHAPVKIVEIEKIIEVEKKNENKNSLENGIVYINLGTDELKQVDVSTLRKAGKYYYLDDTSQKIYFLEKDLGEGNIQLKLIPGIDFHNFSIFEKDERYVHDLKDVYAVFNIPWTEDYEFNVVAGADIASFEPYIVEQFDGVPKGNTFQSWISRDKNHVYYQYGIFENADPKSFVISEHVSINKDKNNVYLWGKILPKADPLTYEVILDLSAAGPGAVYGKDKNNFFIDYCLLTGVDGSSFKFGSEGREYSDKQGEFTINYNKEQNTCQITRE